MIAMPTIGRPNDPSAVRSLRFGDILATYVVNGVITVRADDFFPGVASDCWTDWRELFHARDEMAMSAGGLLIDRGGNALLIDAGVGPAAADIDFGSVDCGSMLDVLAALGRRPEDVDVVAFTHLHFDHAGWAFQPGPLGRDVKTFPRARYLVSAPEWVPFARATGHPDIASLISDGEEVFPGVRAVLTPGHSPGHTAYVITAANGERLVAFGDAFHSPAQLEHPDWMSVADADTAAVQSARRRLLAEPSEPDTVGFGFHFGDQPFGRVGRVEDGRKTWLPVPTVVRAPAPHRGG